MANNPRFEPSAATLSDLPSLETGDHLDRKTFHERYEAMPEGFRAELIGGVVIVPSPLSADHGDTHSLVSGWLTHYRAATPGTRVLDNATIFLGPSSEPQPDACLLIEPEFGGRTSRQGQYIGGPPELVVEVASSSEAYDLHDKYRDYEQAGVLEYVVVLLRERRIEWFVSRDGSFEQHHPQDGLFRSAVFPGLWLDHESLISGDAAKLLEAVGRGVASEEHREFVARLRAPEKPS